MLIKWKILCSFGLVFWSTMCIIDYGFGNILNKGEFSKIQDFDDDIEELEYMAWKQVGTWGIFAFVASFLMCVLMKLLKQIMHKLSQENIEAAEPPNVVNSLRPTAETPDISLKFEVAIPERDTCSATLTNLNLLEAVKDFPVTTDTSATELTTKLVERRCAKLKEEMREMQMSTWKEYSNLNKKLDTLTKEKFDLGRQLTQTQKDNKQLKQQLDEIVSDRALLVKRLEVATKEIKLNTAAKQMTLDKLEEAVECNNQMKSKVLQLGEDKKELEGRYKDLQEKYDILADQVRINLKNRLKEQLNAEVRIDPELEQSEKDIEKVQNKLLDLEKSLQKMRSKTTTAIREHEDNTKNNPSAADGTFGTVVDPKQAESSDDERLNELESRQLANKTSVHNDDKTMDEIKEDSSDSDAQTQENDVVVTLNSFNETQATETDTTIQFRSSSFNAKTISTTTSDVSTSSSNSRSEDDSAISIEDSEADLLYTPGIVSQSPAFRKFLMKVLESPVV